MQCLVVSHLLWLLGTLTVTKFSSVQFIALSLFLTLFSSLPFFVGFIMADIFTPIMFLTIYILAFHYRSLSKTTFTYILALDCVSTAAHISNLALSLGLIVVFGIFLYSESYNKRDKIKLYLCLMAPAFATATAILLFNVVIFSSFSLSPAGQSFFMANLIEYGPARDYLHSACPQENYKLCVFEAKLPPTADELLWSSGIFERLGGFPGMRDEASQIVLNTIASRPGSVLTTIITNLKSGLFLHEPAAEFQSKVQVDSFAALLETKFGHRAALAYASSAEMQDRIPHILLKSIDDIVFPLSFCILLFLALYFRKAKREPFFRLSFSIVCFFLGNTLLCTALSGVHDRYQARVTWLLPMAATLLLCQAYRVIYTRRVIMKTTSS
jgi:hypothetical protein